MASNRQVGLWLRDGLGQFSGAVRAKEWNTARVKVTDRGADVSIPDLSRAQWRTSSNSSGNCACVQVTAAPGGIIAVRDSKDPAGPRLIINQQTWHASTSRTENGAASTS
jgi:Domain of unknown function (DUF397)